MNAHEYTLCRMRKQQATLPATLSIFARFSSDHSHTKNTDRNHIPVLAITEHYLQKLGESARPRRRNLDRTKDTRAQARYYYDATKKNIANPAKSNASIGWLTYFKKRCEVKFAKVQG